MFPGNIFEFPINIVALALRWLWLQSLSHKKLHIKLSLGGLLWRISLFHYNVGRNENSESVHKIMDERRGGSFLFSFFFF